VKNARLSCPPRPPFKAGPIEESRQPDHQSGPQPRRDSPASSSIPQKKVSGYEEVSILGAAKWSNLSSEKICPPPSGARWSGSAKPAPRGKESSAWKPSKRFGCATESTANTVPSAPARLDAGVSRYATKTQHASPPLPIRNPRAKSRAVLPQTSGRDIFAHSSAPRTGPANLQSRTPRGTKTALEPL
jgi:hypothetical protein